MKRKTILLVLAVASFNICFAQYWQQRVKYTMDVNVNVTENKFTGKQKLEYWNNSPDTLTKVFYHLYWNAFQPGSMMDVRSRRQGTIASPRGVDWDARVKDRIQNLTPNEIGYQKIVSIKMNGRTQSTKLWETILEVDLDKPILPKTKVVFDVVFEAQVPIQIRRSGRDNAEGVQYSMSQWYPKLCEYDVDGWHPTQYVAREFYGVWGDFDVNITIDKKYVLGATGYLTNPNEIGYGYEAKGSKVNRAAGNTLTWKFTAPNVHDFVWAADADYTHISKTVRDGLVLHAFYKIVPELLKKQYEGFSATQKSQYSNNPDSFVTSYKREWENVLELAARGLPYMDSVFGKYPYKQYSFIQGGDGGMEYPMATLLKGAGSAVIFHEWMHSWYQGMMGSNEGANPWMDEGFSDYAQYRIKAYMQNIKGFAYTSNYGGYIALTKSGKEEPLTTPGDEFNTNSAYSAGSYSKGCVFIEQLGYITGASVRDKILLEYYRLWRFKHPSPSDFFRVAENVSGLKLDWYRDYWINSTKTIDYSIDSLWEEGGKTKVRLNRIGMVPMPIDLQLTFKDSTKEIHYVPLNVMYGEKPVEDPSIPRTTYEAWKWTNSTYIIETKRKLTDIILVEIDPSLRMADVDRNNNKLVLKWPG